MESVFTISPKKYIDKFRLAMADEEQTEVSASKRRLARAGLSAFSMGGAKVVQILIGIVSVPILLTYLGREGYGLLITITSVLGWFSLTDMGIGLGVKNALIEAFGQNDRYKAQSYVSTGFVGLSTVSLVLMVAFLISWTLIPWDGIFKLTSGRFTRDLNMLVLITSFLVFFRIPLGIINSIYSADQKDYVNSSWGTLGSVLSFMALIIAVNFDWGIVWLTVSRSGMALAAVVLCGLLLFTREKEWLRPRLSLVSEISWRRIWSSSLSFFIIQMSMIAIFHSDIFLVNYFISAEDVPLYSMPARIFLYVNLTISFIVSPFWPAFGEAAQKGHWGWIRKTFRNLIFASVGISLPMAVLFSIFGPTIINFWSRGIVQSPRPIMIILGLYSIVQAWTSVHAVFLNGLDKMHSQAASAVAQAVLNIVLSIFLVKRLGIIGVALGSLISYSLTAAWFLPVLSYKIFKSQGREVT